MSDARRRLAQLELEQLTRRADGTLTEEEDDELIGDMDDCWRGLKAEYRDEVNERGRQYAAILRRGADDADKQVAELARGLLEPILRGYKS